MAMAVVDLSNGSRTGTDETAALIADERNRLAGLDDDRMRRVEATRVEMETFMMLTIALPDAAELRSNSTFEALMWALSRPGDVRTLPEPGLTPLVEALVDIECAAFGDTVELRRLIGETRAEVAEIRRRRRPCSSRAASGRPDAAQLPALRQRALPRRRRDGGHCRPDRAGTAVAAQRSGIDGVREIALALPAEFWRLRDELCLYPEGFDLFVVDGTDVVGLPRSTQIEVL